MKSLYEYIKEAKRIARKGKLYKASDDEISYIVKRMIESDLRSTDATKELFNHSRYLRARGCIKQCHKSRQVRKKNLKQQKMPDTISDPDRLYGSDDEADITYREVLSRLLSMRSKGDLPLRNIKMYLRHIVKGDTLQSIADCYSCTRQNVRQHVLRVNEMLQAELCPELERPLPEPRSQAGLVKNRKQKNV